MEMGVLQNGIQRLLGSDNAREIIELAGRNIEGAMEALSVVASSNFADMMTTFLVLFGPEATEKVLASTLDIVRTNGAATQMAIQADILAAMDSLTTEDVPTG